MHRTQIEKLVGESRELVVVSDYRCTNWPRVASRFLRYSGNLRNMRISEVLYRESNTHRISCQDVRPRMAGTFPDHTCWWDTLWRVSSIFWDLIRNACTTNLRSHHFRSKWFLHRRWWEKSRKDAPLPIPGVRLVLGSSRISLGHMVPQALPEIWSQHLSWLERIIAHQKPKNALGARVSQVVEH